MSAHTERLEVWIKDASPGVLDPADVEMLVRDAAHRMVAADGSPVPPDVEYEFGPFGEPVGLLFRFDVTWQAES